MKTTTLNELNKHNPCKYGKAKLLKYIGKTELDDEELSFITILESNGIEDAIWCLRALPDYDLDVMTFKLKCARRVEHLDKTGTAKKTLDVVERFINGEATKDELKAAYAAAAAAYAAYSAYAAAVAAVAAAAAAVADYAASDAYAVAVDAAAVAVDAAAVADAVAAVADASAERKYQAEIFREIFG